MSRRDIRVYLERRLCNLEMSGMGLGVTGRYTWQMLSEWAYIHQLKYAQERGPSCRSVRVEYTAPSDVVPVLDVILVLIRS